MPPVIAAREWHGKGGMRKDGKPMGVEKNMVGSFGAQKSGPLNLITDVPGVLAGHFTLQNGNVQTGVTAILPHRGNCFQEKCVAAAHVINGFGKSAGLIQLQELGSLETPILLTNTFSVGTVSTALIKYMLEQNPDIGISTGTVNPLVLECNDGRLNDIRGMHVQQQHALSAIESAAAKFEEGAIGAGTGMCCYGLKGGIGSSSRRIELNDGAYTLGTLVLSNFGALSDLTVSGRALGQEISRIQNGGKAANEAVDRGSVIVIIATDLPLTSRQLSRVSRRAQNGLAKTGSITGNGSGEIVICFSTANRIPHYPPAQLCPASYLHEEYLDLAFRAACESVEESVISSLLHAKTTADTAKKISCLSDYLPQLQ